MKPAQAGALTTPPLAPGLPNQTAGTVDVYGLHRNATAVVGRGIQTLKKDLATRVARKGGQWSDHFERAAYNARPHETVYGAPEDVEKQPATKFRLQDNADKFQHNKDLTDRRMKAVEDEELQPPVRRPEHGGPGDPAEAGAAGAAGQRQRGGPTDEAGQAGGCEAAGRLPGASEAHDCLFGNGFSGLFRPPCVQGASVEPFLVQKTV